MRHHSSRAIVAAAITAAFGTSAHAAEFKAGDWDLTLGGYINAYYTTVTCSGNQGINGLAIVSKALGCGGSDGRTTIGNGLLPNALISTAKTKQDGLDIGATFMIGAATATDSAIGNNSQVDVRQAFLTVGTAEIGTFKFGRDYGDFGKNAILSDMTLLGAGAPVQATQRGRVALGHIGAGYTYLGHYGQITYTSPSFSGLTLTGGVYSPIKAAGFDSGKSPQVQLIANYGMGGLKVWAGLKSQKFENPAASSYTMSAVEAGGSYAIGDFGLLGNIQSGKGLGVLSDGDSGNVKSTNYLLQATYKVTPKVKLGLSYGQNRVKDGLDPDLKSNDNLTGGVYYGITKSLTLVGELSQTTSKPFAGDSAKLKGVSLGAILFF